MTGFVVLLRGINVGGRNKVPMTLLRATFEDAGYTGVDTYIQSGNVLFSEPPAAAAAGGLEADVERLLAESLGLAVPVVVRTGEQLDAVVRDAPGGFGQEPQTHHSDVVFLRDPLTAARAMAAIEMRDGVDAAWPGDRVVYFQRLSAQRTRSRLNRVMAKPEYKLMTIRNWRTTTTLRDLLRSR